MSRFSNHGIGNASGTDDIVSGGTALGVVGDGIDDGLIVDGRWLMVDGDERTRQYGHYRSV